MMAWNLPPMPRHMPRELLEAGTGLLDDLRDVVSASVESSGIAASDDLHIVQTVVASPAQDALADAAERAELLVMGTRTRGLLSVSRHVSAVAGCPTAMIPEPAAGRSGSGDRLVVGADGSDASLAALAWAEDESARRRLPLTVVMVDVDADAASRVRQAVARDAPGEREVRFVETSGDAPERLLDEAAGAECLVLGQHGRFAVTRHLPSLGSVSRRVAAHPVCPVVIVPLASRG
jgi:nucleotide-binding universal stress UspA family protein